MDARTPSLISTGLVVVSVISPLLSLGAVLLRTKARMRTKAGLLGDDWWMVATWVSRRSFICLDAAWNQWLTRGTNRCSQFPLVSLFGSMLA